MVRVDVGVHTNCVHGEESGACWQSVRESHSEVSHEMLSIFDVSREEVSHDFL